MMRKGLTVVLLVLVAIGSTTGASEREDDPRIVWFDYDLAPPGPFLSLSASTGAGTVDAGGSTVSVHADETHAIVYVLDDTHRKAPARWTFYDQEGQALASGDFCFSATARIPVNASEVTVRPSPLVDPCPATGNHGPATAGEVLLVLDA